MMADIRRVMAGAAKARDSRDVEVVIEAGNANDVDLRVVEHLFAARYGAAVLAHHATLVIIVAPVIGEVDGLEDLRGIGHRHAEVAIVVAMTGIKPGPIQIEHL